ncbi:MAG: hypothetical protein JSV65_08430 [Armatimonadota bacterium]|nr:MAG: hypothetical protein JSV65_08430 [Armatimonadota bacterium]
MSPDHHESEGDGLTVLTVREGEASIRDFRFDCRGETSCRADLGELLQLLERRHADIAVFLSHPDLVGSLIEELRRRGRQVPDMVIAPPATDAEARVTVSVSLSGLSDSAYPQELLARLYEALRAAQAGASSTEAGIDAERAASGASGTASGTEGGAPEPTAGASQDAEGAPVSGHATPPRADGAPAVSAADGGEGAASAEVTGDSPGAAPNDDGARPSPEVEELSARLERILNQRLHDSQP